MTGITLIRGAATRPYHPISPYSISLFIPYHPSSRQDNYCKSRRNSQEKWIIYVTPASIRLYENLAGRITQKSSFLVFFAVPEGKICSFSRSVCRFVCVASVYLLRCTACLSAGIAGGRRVLGVGLESPAGKELV